MMVWSVRGGHRHVRLLGEAGLETEIEKSEFMFVFVFPVGLADLDWLCV